ncbi:peptide chain release factor 1 [Blastopirellula marina]|uniref:Peptide chain release factor 1 n=1 Tax=Blastopirellula marina TaxID=124 RepID=A0A2S8F3I8_9BACT|nr:MULTISPECIES: peptide chain release factor 1 [Pirellulaceae]PQO26720.1 peptide chain release factor 1 [Blastopirellula marina]RCS46199.1 peptide chain release factor 1 [Bremerella cremea]
MREILEEKLARFEFLEKQMSDPDVLSNSSKMANVAREHGSLARVATRYRQFKDVVSEIDDARELMDGDDDEMAELAEADLVDLKARREKIWRDLLDMTIGGEDADRDKIVLEIRGGTGGDEAALFARDLYEMYKRFAEMKKWKYEVMESNPTELGGFKEVIISVHGEGVYREMQYESGGHRVQRVPETETKGRVHTSAATVAVMAEPEEVEFNLSPDSYTVERYAASSGPGGQHVNKTASAVRLIHQETGVIVQCCEERSQHKNLDRALRLLKTKLYDSQREKEAKERADERKSLVGSGDRSQRIRTYNFPENRITDHRINLTLYKLDQVMAGHLQPVIDALIDHDREQLRGEMGDLD